MEVKNAELLTNYEVLQVLRYNARYRGDQAQEEMSSPEVLAIEGEVKKFLEATPASTYTRQSISSLVEALKTFNLSKLEINQIVNTLPQYPVELYLIISNIDERFSEQKIQDLLSVIAAYRQS